MNGFRIAILSLMVVVVAVFVWVVAVELGDKSLAHENASRESEMNDREEKIMSLSAKAQTETADESITPNALVQQQRDEVQAAMNSVHANEEQRTLAQMEEQRRLEEEETMAAQQAKELAAAAAIGMVTVIEPNLDYFAFKPLGKQEIYEGLIIALRRGDGSTFICEGKVTHQHESGVWFAVFKFDDYFPMDAKERKNNPAEGDLVFITDYDTADQLRKEAMSYPESESAPAEEAP